MRRLALCLAMLASLAPPHDRAAPPRAIRSSVFVVRYWPGHERLARDVARAAVALSRLPALPATAVDSGGPILLDLAPDERRFLQLAGYPPEWGAGVAIPGEDRIVLPAYVSRRGDVQSLAPVMRHEIAHIALHRYLEPAAIPRWFDEGYARWASGEWDEDGPWMLRLAFATHRAPPLDSLELDWPRGAADARVAYLLSMSVVEFLDRRGGEPVLALMLRRWKETGALEPALRRTYGLSLSGLEEGWKAEVRRRYGWTYVLTNTLVFWAFASLLILFLFARRRRRNRLKLGRMIEAEIPDHPAYWLEGTEAGSVGEREAPEAGPGGAEEPRETGIPPRDPLTDPRDGR